MYLYPYSIFALSSKKRTVNEDGIPTGIYDTPRYNYNEADRLAGQSDYDISVLLGKVTGDINLICLDLDDCCDENGELNQETKDFIKPFSTKEYEISKSGTGLHVFILTKLNLDTFIVKELEGCKSFECYTNKRHIVTTYTDFRDVSYQVGKHDEFILDLYRRVEEQKSNQNKSDIVEVMRGQVFNGSDEQLENAMHTGRTPVEDMYTLRGCGFKDTQLIETIDENPDCVDQSAHDAKLIRKLMYYTLSFDSAWEMAEKTNYWKAKNDKHKKKWYTSVYRERTRKFLMGG